MAEHLDRAYDSPYTLIGYLNGAGGTLIRRLVAGDLPPSGSIRCRPW